MWKSLFLCAVMLGQGMAQEAPEQCVAQKALIPGMGVRISGVHDGNNYEDYWFISGSESSGSLGPSNKFRRCGGQGPHTRLDDEGASSGLSKGCGSEQSSFTPKKDKDTIGDVPRLCPSDKPELMAILKEMNNQGAHFDKMMYAVRNVNFTYLAQGTGLEPVAPLGDAAGKLLAPLQHHQLFFHVDGAKGFSPNTAVIGNQTSGRTWLLVHMQGDGVHGRFITDSELPSSGKAWKWEIAAPAEPRWLLEFLRDDSHTTYSHLFWNCQIFAANLLSFVGDECRGAKFQACPPPDAEDRLPWIIYQGKGLRVFCSLCLTLVAFTAALIWRFGWPCCCLRRCRQGKVSDPSLNSGLLTA